MKKNFFYAMMSAIALTSAVSFTSCASDDGATVENNPTYDGTSVRTDFAFSITKASQGTRMTAANVQDESSTVTPFFRGMQHMFLLPYTGEPTSANASTLATNSNIFALGGLNSSEIIPDNTHKKIYSLTFPIGTNNMLFYGTAANESSLASYQIGKITSTLWPSGTDLGSNQTLKHGAISFSLAPIVDEENVFNKNGDATKILNYLSHIAQAKYNKGTAETPNYVTWASTVGKSANDGAYRALASLYTAITSINTGEARSGSTESVKRMVFDLYKAASAINHESSVEDVQNIAKAICEAIESTSDGITFTVQLSETDATAITIGSLTDAQVNGAAGWVASISGIANNFPANVGLPMGAAQLRFNSTEPGTFAFNTEKPTDPILNIGKDFTVYLNQIDYPSELIYFDNSPIRVTDQYKTEADFPSTPALWDKDDATGFNTTEWKKNGAVESTTRAVALQNNINYGVALLESTVMLAADAVSGMTDNKANILSGTATNQTDIDPKKFNITGILIGGQPATVNWNLVEESSTASFSNVIYDRDVANYGIDLAAATPVTLTTSESAKNYTVVFDNYFGGDKQKDVLIALEIVNGDKDFYGKHNMIPAGSTFYLVGTLQRSSGYYASDKNALWTPKHEGVSSDYRVTHEDVCRVFCQDYKTKAKITLSKNSLQNAYSSIPDLTSTETVFGLSVDLTWEEGLTFDVNIQ